MLLFLEWGLLTLAVWVGLLARTANGWTVAGTVLIIGSAILRKFRTGTFSRRTALDLPLALFLVTALIAWWVAPDRPAAAARFYLYLAAGGVYYAAANSTPRTLTILSDIAVAGAPLAGLALFAQYDWDALPVRFAITGEVGRWLNTWSPDLGLGLPPWNAFRNMLASVLGLILPLAAIRWTIHLGRLADELRLEKVEPGARGQELRRAWWGAAWSGGALALGMLALLLTESRTPWIFMAVAAALGVARWAAARFRRTRALAASSLISIGLFCTALLAGLVWVSAPEPLQLLRRFPGPDSVSGREEIYTQAWHLSKDTPFTGGGLAAFPALYATYVRVIPHRAFLDEDTGNSAYLNILVEQGWPGLSAFLLLLGAAIRAYTWRLNSPLAGYRPFVLAGGLGLAFVIVQGFVHATLVATRAVPVLLLPIGMALAAPPPVPEARTAAKRISAGEKGAPALWMVPLSGMIIFLSLLFGRFWAASWHTNWGALAMNRVLLEGFPRDEWDDSPQVERLEPATAWFEKALQADPALATAHHRLGRIAMLRRDYGTARAHLETAHAGLPQHRGILKALAYSYAWDGEEGPALDLLRGFPEAENELDAYVIWWEEQGREDLVQVAGRLRSALRR